MCGRHFRARLGPCYQPRNPCAQFFFYHQTEPHLREQNLREQNLREQNSREQNSLKQNLLKQKNYFSYYYYLRAQHSGKEHLPLQKGPLRMSLN
jgi:hypothetical protein